VTTLITGARSLRWVSLGLAIVVAHSLPLAVARTASHEIVITDAGFEPVELTVIVGEPVTWTNTTATEHTVTSDDGTLDSGPLGPGESYGHVFEAPGTIAYHDDFNPGGFGTIVVEAAPATTPPSGTPEPTPPAGTLPPDFSPDPLATPSPTPTTQPTPAPSAGPTTDDDEGGSSGAPLLLGAGLIVVGVVGYLLWRRRTA
jgi:plastocyanin